MYVHKVMVFGFILLLCWTWNFLIPIKFKKHKKSVNAEQQLVNNNILIFFMALSYVVADYFYVREKNLL